MNENETAPENTIVVKCAICGSEFAVPKESYDALVGICEGDENNYICSDCALIPSNTPEDYDEEDDYEDEDYEDDLPMSDDPEDVIKQALGE